MRLDRAAFGALSDGTPVDLYSCANDNGMVVELAPYGATLVAVWAPDRDGMAAPITLGFPGLAGYLQHHPYFGATVGRYANRIAGATFRLEGQTHRLEANDGPNHLHGGGVGLARRLWEAEPFQSADEAGVRFHYVSPAGEDRYPGSVSVEAAYSLTSVDELVIAFSATADAVTPLNLINHAYWNLAGAGDILDHELEIAAEHYLPVDAGQIPTGRIAPVADTPFDFRTPKPIGRDLFDIPGDRVGYDHSFVLRHRETVAAAARLYEPRAGRVMEVSTTQPGLHLYTGNNLRGFEPHGGFERFAGVCLETQHFPDSPNRPEFPSTILAPGERYAHTTVHRFSTA